MHTPHTPRDWMDLTREPKRRSRERPVVVIDVGHGWLPDDNDPTQTRYDAGAVYNPDEDRDPSRTAERVEEYQANVALARAMGKALMARGFGVQFTNLSNDGHAQELYDKTTVPANPIQFRFDRAHAVAQAQHVAGYISVHHDSGFMDRQHGAAVAVHIAAGPEALRFGRAIAHRVHGQFCPEGEVQAEPVVSNAQKYREVYVGNFAAKDKAVAATHDFEADGLVLRHGTNVIRPDDNPPKVTRGLGTIPAVLIERAVLWNPHDRRKVLSERARDSFAMLVAEGVADYWDAKCRDNESLTRRAYEGSPSR